MADDWDDDDFGTFESAGAGDPVDSTSASSTAPAWLLAAQSPTHTNITDSVVGTGDSSFLELGAGETAAVKQVSLPAAEESANNSLSTLDDSCKQDTQSDTPVSAPVVQSQSIDWQAFEDQSSVSFTTETLNLGLQTLSDDTTSSYDAPQDSASVAAPPTCTMQIESTALSDLKNQLDNALLLKQQTEQNMEDLRTKLSSKINDMVEERERREKDHQFELEKVKEERSREIQELREDTQKMMKILTDQYSDLCNRVAQQQQTEFEKKIEEVTRKCVGVLELQQTACTVKISKEVEQRITSIDSVLEKCKSDVKDFTTSQCDDVVERCSNASEAVEGVLKDRISEELEKRNKLDLKSKEEALKELTQTYKEDLQRALEEERCKHREQVATAISEAVKMTKESVANEQKNREHARERHLLALQMLLTSSQEHLKQLAVDLPSNDESS